MSSINRAFLIGNLGKDPELKQTPNSCVTTFSIATSDSYQDKQGKKIETTEWHNIVVWGKIAENCNKYLKKGSKVLIEGSIKNETYEKDGEKKYITKILAQKVTFLDTKEKAIKPDPTPDEEFNEQLRTGMKKAKEREKTKKEDAKDWLESIPF